MNTFDNYPSKHGRLGSYILGPFWGLASFFSGFKKFVFGVVQLDCEQPKT